VKAKAKVVPAPDPAPGIRVDGITLHTEYGDLEVAWIKQRILPGMSIHISLPEDFGRVSVA
jgi:hypothetical protein